MAEVGYIFPEDAAKQVVEVGNAIKATDDKLLKYTEDASKLIALLKQQNISFEQLQKVQKEAVDTTTKLDAVGKQLLQSEEKLKQVADKRTEQIIKNRTETTKLTQALKDKLKANQAEEGSLVRMRAKLKELTEQYDRTGNRTKAATAEINKLSREIGKAEAATNRHGRGVGGYADQIGGLGKKFLGALGITSAILLFTSAIKKAFTAIVEFQKAQSTLQSVSGKTRSELLGLTKQAKMLGGITEFTATEVTNLQIELAKLGFTTNEITLSTQAILNFASATGADLSAAAKTAGVALRAFGMDASRMNEAVSTMAVATTKSALSFADFDTILSTVGPVARAFGFSLQDTVAILGKLRDAGFDASSAATATRNILLNLADTNGKLAKSLGGSVTNFDELIPALVSLREKGVNLNETLQLTDKRSVAAFNQFLQTAEGASELRDAITDVNDELQIMVDKKLDNLAGDLTKLSSAWEGFILKGEGGVNAFRIMIQFLNDLVIKLANIDLIFKNLSTESAARGYDLMLSLNDKKAKKFRDVIKQYEDQSIKFIATNKELIQEEIRNSGFSKKETLLLYNEFIKRRFEQHRVEVAASADKNRKIITGDKKAAEETENIKNEVFNKEIERRIKFDRAILDGEEKRVQEELSIWAEEINQRYELNLKKIELEKSVNDTIAQIREDARKTEEEKANEESDKILARIKKINEEEENQKEETNQQLFKGGVDLANTLFDLKSSQLQREFEMAEGNEKKQKEISAKIAKTEKNKALFDIAISTAVAITKALPNLVLAGIAGAIGLVQAGIVMAKPIPKFATGTDFAPKEFIAGEEGREIVKTKSGDVVMAEKATHFKGNRFKGATVYTNRETEQIIEQSGRGNNFTFDTRELRDEMRAVKNAIVKKPIAITDNSGRVIGKQSNNYRETYLNRMQNGR